MEGTSTIVAIVLASILFLMLIMFFFLLRRLLRLNNSINNWSDLKGTHLKEIREIGSYFIQTSHNINEGIRPLTNSLHRIQQELESIENRIIMESRMRSSSPPKTNNTLADINELRDISENLDQFAKGVKDLSAFITGVQELNKNLIDHNQRTEALVTIADFYKKQMTDIETRQDAIRSSVVKIDDQIQSALKMLEENSQKGLNQLQQTFLHQTDVMEKISRSSMLEEKLLHIDSALKSVSLLQPLQDSISKLNDRLLSIKPENYSLSCNTFTDNVKSFDLSLERREKERINIIINETNTKINNAKKQTEESKEHLAKLNEQLELVLCDIAEESKTLPPPLSLSIDKDKDIYIKSRHGMLRLNSFPRVDISDFLGSEGYVKKTNPFLKSILEKYYFIKSSINHHEMIIKQHENYLAELTRKKTMQEDKRGIIITIENILEKFERGATVRLKVVDDNMAPTISLGDNVIIEPQIEGYYEDDIVYVRLLNCYKLRRIISYCGGGELEVQGDANEYPEHIVVADIIGKVVKIEKKTDEKKQSKK